MEKMTPLGSFQAKESSPGYTHLVPLLGENFESRAGTENNERNRSAGEENYRLELVMGILISSHTTNAEKSPIFGLKNSALSSKSQFF
jgi:hypothetical protein